MSIVTSKFFKIFYWSRCSQAHHRRSCTYFLPEKFKTAAPRTGLHGPNEGKCAARVADSKSSPGLASEEEKAGVPPKDIAIKTATGKYICAICGYVYDPAVGDPDRGIPAGTPFEALPEDWHCPRCKQSKDNFTPA